MSANLKPCPFCGGPARIREDKKGGIIGCMPEDNLKPETPCHGNVMVYVGFNARRSNQDGGQLTKRDAIKTWNTRLGDAR